MPDNLVFLCGPHGSGKSTLAEEMAKEEPLILIPELYSRNVKFNIDDAIYRQILKICSRAIENFEYLELARNNPDRIVLGNRCIYDVLAYNHVYWQRGWISQEQCRDFDMHTSDFFRNENQEPWAIVLNPGFDVVLRHLQERWGEKGKKWKEDDLEYAKLACHAYERYQGQEKILYIDHEIDLESREEIRDASRWVEEIFESEEVFARV